MKRRTILAGVCAVAFAAAPAVAAADQPPGQLGYEGQPGNQGGASGTPDGASRPGCSATRASPATRAAR
jgi:hypothetical protein